MGGRNAGLRLFLLVATRRSSRLPPTPRASLSWPWPLGYLAMTMSMYFQAVEKVGIATFTGLLRYVICSVPLMYLLGNMMGVQGVWFALVAADAITGLISIALAVRESKRLATL